MDVPTRSAASGATTNRGGMPLVGGSLAWSWRSGGGATYRRYQRLQRVRQHSMAMLGARQALADARSEEDTRRYHLHSDATALSEFIKNAPPLEQVRRRACICRRPMLVAGHHRRIRTIVPPA